MVAVFDKKNKKRFNKVITFSCIQIGAILSTIAAISRMKKTAERLFAQGKIQGVAVAIHMITSHVTEEDATAKLVNL